MGYLEGLEWFLLEYTRLQRHKPMQWPKTYIDFPLREIYTVSLSDLIHLT